MLIVIPKGLTVPVPPDLGEVLEVDMSVPITTQLIPIPRGTKVSFIAPEDYELRDYFLHSAHSAWASIEISRTTYEALLPNWFESMLDNWPLLQKALPVDRHKKKEENDTAIIIGNAPSCASLLDELTRLDISQADTFVCWHAMNKMLDRDLPISYLCHMDTDLTLDGRLNGFVLPDTYFIAAPKASPEFVKAGQGRLLVYLQINEFMNGIIAKKLGCLEHRPVINTVVAMMVNSALYMGYKRLIFIGMDNAWPADGDNYSGSCNITEYENQHKNKIKTYEPFVAQHRALNQLASLYMNLDWYQASKFSLDASNIPYKALNELFNTK